MAAHLFISAGEPSGDRHAASLVRALRAKDPDLIFWGFGGPALNQAGVQCIDRFTEHDAVVGLEGVLSGIQRFRKRLQRFLAFVQQHIDLVILVDYPGFHLFFAQALRRLKVPVVYFILPQAWAWAAWRTRVLRRATDLRLSILPFEPIWFHQHGVEVVYVGHPLVDQIPAPQKETDLHQPPILGFFPGSRPTEARRHLPIFQKIRERLQSRISARFWLSQPPGLSLENLGPVQGFEVQTEPPRTWASSVDLAVAASGTITLELALLGVPTFVIYQTSRWTAWVGRRLLQVPWLSLPNLLVREPVMPEFIQKIPVDRIVDSLESLLENPQAYAQIRTRLLSIRDLLGPPGAMDRAADQILEFLRTQRDRRPESRMPANRASHGAR